MIIKKTLAATLAAASFAVAMAAVSTPAQAFMQRVVSCGVIQRPVFSPFGDVAFVAQRVCTTRFIENGIGFGGGVIFNTF